jgi:GYF domain 2
MISNLWFLDREHKQRGPVGQDEFVKLIREGTIGPETLIWTTGMSEWLMAGQVEGVSALFGPSVPPPVPLGAGAASVAPAGTGALSAALPV